MLSFVDACLGRLPGPLVQAPRLVRLIAPLRLRPALTAAPRHFAGPAAGAAGALAQRSRRLHVAAAVDDFYAASSVTFSSLGLSDDVCAALQAAGYPRPAHAQASGGGGSGGRTATCEALLHAAARRVT